MKQSDEAGEPQPQSGPTQPRAIIPTLQVRLFGGFALMNSQGQPLRLGTRKAEALLALLALTPGQPRARDKLCALLWPEVRDAQARHSLRQTLFHVRKVLATSGQALLSDPRGLQLSAADVDVVRFEAGVTLATRESLLDAWSCYRGDLLDGLCVDEKPFEHWLRFERERLRSALCHALSQLVALDCAAERYHDATAACTRWLELEPLREDAHRSLMRLLVAQGHETAALAHYHTLSRRLRAEHAAEPDRLTQQLRQEIEAGAESEGARPWSQSPATSSTPVTTGRSRELGQVLAALPLAEKGEAPVTLLVGEAGVGKTHLCDRAAHAAEARGFRVLRARCFETEQVLPLAPWANLFDAAICAETPLSDERRAELATLVPELASDGPVRAPDARRLFHAVHELVGQLADREPLLIVLDDVHWADEMSARLLSYLGRQQRRCRSLFLVSARQEDLAASSFICAALDELAREQRLERVQLVPLSAADTRELALNTAREQSLPPLEDARVEQIWSISEGNPLVVVESVRALACGTLARDVTELPVPERVRSLILSRVAKVSTAARELLAVAAVAGRELDLEVLLAALDGLPLSTALDELAQAQLVHASGDRVYFTHDRIRETLYRDMLPVRRRFLHGRVASALERHANGGPHSVLGHIGYHYSKAGDAAAAVDYLLRFADKARHDHGVAEALVVLEQAYADSSRLPQAERDETQLAIVIRQAPCLASLGRFAELLARLRAHAPRLEALDAAELAAPFHFFWALALALMAERREAEGHAQLALSNAVRCGDTRVTGYTHALLSYLCQMTGGYRVGVRHGLRATELLERCGDAAEAAALAWLSLGLNQLWLGDPRSALLASDRASAIARAADNQRGQVLAATAAGCIYAYTDDWQRALEVTQRAVQTRQEPFTLVSSAWMAAWAYSGVGRTAEAITLLTHVISQLDQHGMRAWSAHAMTILADAQLRAGAAAQAVRVAREAREVATSTDDRTCAGWAMRVEGHAALVLGKLGQARECLDGSVELFEAFEAPIDIAKGLAARAALWLAEGSADKARQDLERARTLYTAAGVEAALDHVVRLEAAAREGAEAAPRPL